MFKKLAKSLIRKSKPFDPSTIDDGVAQETEWTPLKRGGTNLRTHNLVKVSRDRLAFKPTIGVLALGCAIPLFALGLGASLVFSALGRSSDDNTAITIVLATVFTIAFCAVGVFLLRSMRKPRFFDLHEGWYWASRKSIELANRNEGRKHGVPIEDIYALQIIREYCRSGGKNHQSYYSYELNLVLTDTSRINVVDQSNVRTFYEDAKRLAKFLDIPLWDGSRQG